MKNDKNQTLINNFIIYHFNMDKYMKFWYNGDKEEIEKNKYLIMLDLSKEDLVRLSKKDKAEKAFNKGMKQGIEEAKRNLYQKM